MRSVLKRFHISTMYCVYRFLYPITDIEFNELVDMQASYTYKRHTLTYIDVGSSQTIERTHLA